jgi:hypothetical protein
MDWWRISKYNPAFRDENYAYLRDEWNSVGDIGHTFEGVTLDAATYLATEAAHVEAVRAFMADAKVEVLTVTDFEGPSEEDYEYLRKLALPDSHELAQRMRQIHEGDEISGELIGQILRLLLRQVFWCRLVDSQRFVVHCSEYLYIHIGTVAPSERALARVQELGLFVDPWWDPLT